MAPSPEWGLCTIGWRQVSAGARAQVNADDAPKTFWGGWKMNLCYFGIKYGCKLKRNFLYSLLYLTPTTHSQTHPISSGTSSSKCLPLSLHCQLSPSMLCHHHPRSQKSLQHCLPAWTKSSPPRALSTSQTCPSLSIMRMSSGSAMSSSAPMVYH